MNDKLTGNKFLKLEDDLFFEMKSVMTGGKRSSSLEKALERALGLEESDDEPEIVEDGWL